MKITYHIWATVKDPTEGEIHKHLNSIKIKGEGYFGYPVAEMDVEREIELTEQEEGEYCKGVVEGIWAHMKETDPNYEFTREKFNILMYGLTEKK